MEMLESVDDLKTSRSIGGRRFPNVEMLDAKSASALKKQFWAIPVPSNPVMVPGPQGISSSDSCLQLDTRN